MIDADSVSKPSKILIRIAPLMFWGAVFFLLLVATIMVLVVDVPRLDTASVLGEEALDREPVAVTLRPWDDEVLLATIVVETLLGLLWPIFFIEAALVLWFSRELPCRKSWRWQWLFIGLCPPLRLAPPHLLCAGRHWLPWLGWCEGHYRLYRRVERLFSGPMVIVASFILPVLIIEWTMHDRLLSTPWLRVLMHVSTGAIWFAFALEFILMIELSNRKLSHLKKHWIDIVIILLPLLSFLRSLKAIKATKIAKFTKLQQLSRMLRVYRLRGLSTRAFRAIVVLDVLQRFVGGDPQKRWQKLKTEEAMKQEELREIQEELMELEKLIAKSSQQEKLQVDNQPESSE